MLLSFRIPKFLELCGSVGACWAGPALCCPVQPPPDGLSQPEVLGPRVGLYLGHFLPVGLGVQGCLGEQGWMLFRGNTKFIVERVVPDLGGRWRGSTMT